MQGQIGSVTRKAYPKTLYIFATSQTGGHTCPFHRAPKLDSQGLIHLKIDSGLIRPAALLKDALIYMCLYICE
jgi:hypothetical protein